MSVKYWILLLMATTMAACKYTGELEEEEVPGKFKISVTDYLSKADDLHPDAVFQYSSPYRTVYLLVLDTAKTNLTLDAYGELASQKIAGSLKDAVITPVDTVTISGAPTKVYEIEGIITDEGIWYYLAVVEGKQQYYQVLGWTLTRRVDKYSNDIRKMVQSFEMID